MATSRLSAEVVTATVLGILQLCIGLVSLWQQRQFHRASGQYVASLEMITLVNKPQNREGIRDDIRSEYCCQCSAIQTQRKREVR